MPTKKGIEYRAPALETVSEFQSIIISYILVTVLAPSICNDTKTI